MDLDTYRTTLKVFLNDKFKKDDLVPEVKNSDFRFKFIDMVTDKDSFDILDLDAIL